MKLKSMKLARLAGLAGLITASALMLGASRAGADDSAGSTNKQVTVASYYFGNYHPNDPRCHYS